MATLTDGELLTELRYLRKKKIYGVEERRENRRAIQAVEDELARRARLRKERTNSAAVPEEPSTSRAIYEEEKARGWSTE